MRKPRCENKAIHRGAWTKQEDQKLIDYVRNHGEGCWSSIPQAAGLLRCGKSCRLRWVNYLRPDLKRGNFGEDEEELIIRLHALLGNRWSLIAGRLPGRTDNEIKNYWNTHLRKKLMEMGIDPNNHRLEKLGARSSLMPENRSENPGSSKEDSMPSLQESTSGSESNHFFVLPDLNLDLAMQPPVMENRQQGFDPSPAKLLFGKLLI